MYTELLECMRPRDTRLFGVYFGIQVIVFKGFLSTCRASLRICRALWSLYWGFERMCHSKNVC